MCRQLSIRSSVKEVLDYTYLLYQNPSVDHTYQIGKLIALTKHSTNSYEQQQIRWNEQKSLLKVPAGGLRP